jgi:hypothetical protein
MRTVVVKIMSFVARVDMQESHLRTLNKPMRSIEGNLAGVIIPGGVWVFDPKSAYDRKILDAV